MASPERLYVRVYHDDLRRDYPKVYADDAALATWLRLLVLIDKMWPSAAELPRSVRAKPLATLIDAGLVTVDGSCFTVRGYDTERTKRQDIGRNAAAQRWQSVGNANAYAEGMPRPRPSPSPRPNHPPNPPRGANRKEAPEALGAILRRVGS